MKAPLRSVFGWVIYLAIFAALNYPMAVIWRAVQVQPLWLPLASAVVALALFGVLFVAVIYRFWSWCDAPRQLPKVPPSQLACERGTEGAM